MTYGSNSSEFGSLAYLLRLEKEKNIRYLIIWFSFDLSGRYLKKVELE